MTRIVAILEVQWGYVGDRWRTGERAARYFKINPYNHSGKRLIKLVGHRDFYVTNACPDLVTHPSQRGTPDPAWLRENLSRLKPDIVLVCGKVAQATFAKLMAPSHAKVIKIPHPAARTWTKNQMAKVSKRISKLSSGD